MDYTGVESGRDQELYALFLARGSARLDSAAELGKEVGPVGIEPTTEGL